MKKIYFFLLGFLVLESCVKNAKYDAIHNSDVVVIRDITDPMKIGPETDPVFLLYGFSNDKERGAHFRLVPLSDRRLNTFTEFRLPDGKTSESNNTTEDVTYRDHLIEAFHVNIDKAIANKVYLSDTATHRDKSECFYTISSELGKLAERKANERVLLVYSDLFENSDVFNSYSKGGRNLLKSNRDSVARVFNRAFPLPRSLEGIRVYFIYQASNREDEQKFLDMVEVYKLLLQSRHATIFVRADNKLN
jgi:hypothetical protein